VVGSGVRVGGGGWGYRRGWGGWGWGLPVAAGLGLAATAGYYGSCWRWDGFQYVNVCYQPSYGYAPYSYEYAPYPDDGYSEY
jgi:hypothetical protein